MQLSENGVGVRVVSMPCAEIFVEQDASYREAVLPSNIRARVAVEAAHVDYWYKFVGLDGKVVGIPLMANLLLLMSYIKSLVSLLKLWLMR